MGSLGCPLQTAPLHQPKNDEKSVLTLLWLNFPIEIKLFKLLF